MRILSAKTGKLRVLRARASASASTTRAVSGSSLWLAVVARQPAGRARTPSRASPIGNPIKLPFPPSAVATTKDAVWVALVARQRAARPAAQDRPEDRRRRSPTSDYPYGIMSLTTSPTALWVAARRRARDPARGPRDRRGRQDDPVGRNRTEDIVYGRGSLWAGHARGQRRLQGRDLHRRVDPDQRRPASRASSRSARTWSTSPTTARATSTRSTSSRSRVDRRRRCALPVNPFSLALDGDGALWVGSLPENRLSKVATDPGG